MTRITVRNKTEKKDIRLKDILIDSYFVLKADGLVYKKVLVPHKGIFLVPLVCGTVLNTEGTENYEVIPIDTIDVEYLIEQIEE